MNERAKELVFKGADQIGVHLSSSERGHLYALAQELKKWGKKINLTALKGDDDVAVKHLVDSLTVVSMVPPGGRLLDIGSGAGFPAIPLKIVLPRLAVVSVDAVEKKIIFQRHAARLLNLHDFTAIHARGEELPKMYAGYFDCIVSRAFSDLPTFARMALPLLKETGKILAMKGKGGRGEADAAKNALEDLALEVKEIREFQLPFTGDARSVIVLGRKVTRQLVQ